MTKKDYLDQLSAELKKNNVADMADIVSEYEQHFAFKLADGYTEEEISAKLGSPKTIAAQFDSAKDTGKPASGAGFFVKLALAFTAVFEAMFYLVFLAWNIILGASSAATAVLGVCLGIGINIEGLIPFMPHSGSLLLGVSVLGLSGIFGAATVYCFAFLKQMIRASVRWHKNTVSGNTLPPLPFNPQFRPKTKRALRTIMLWSVIVFGVMFVIAFAVLMLQAGAVGFWHHWNWFV